MKMPVRFNEKHRLGHELCGFQMHTHGPDMEVYNGNDETFSLCIPDTYVPWIHWDAKLDLESGKLMF